MDNILEIMVPILALLYIYLLFFGNKIWPMSKLDKWAKREDEMKMKVKVEQKLM